MPIYEYLCRTCHHEFELLVEADDTPACPRCQAEQLERRWSVPSRPRTASPLKITCPADPDAPPCGPMCSRFNN